MLQNEMNKTIVAEGQTDNKDTERLSVEARFADCHVGGRVEKCVEMQWVCWEGQTVETEVAICRIITGCSAKSNVAEDIWWQPGY